MDPITQYMDVNKAYAEYIHAAIVIIAILLVNVIIRIVLAIFDKSLAKKSPYLRIFYQAVNRPVRYVTWIIGLWIILTQFINWQGEQPQMIFAIANKTVKILVILCIAWILLRFARGMRQLFIDKNTRTDGGYNDFSMIETVYKAAQAIIIILLFFSVLGALDIPIVALAGMATVVTGFFAITQQELIKNLFGGTVLYLDRPFAVGDWIYTVDGSIQGTVEKISFRLTIIRGFDRRPIYVPNATFLTAAVVNASRMTNRRILQYIGVRYQDFSKVHKILSDAREMLKKHPAIDQKCITLVCIVNGNTNMGSNTEGVFGSYSINFMVYTFTKTTNWVKFQAAQDEIMLKIGEIIEQNGAQIAFPTTTLNIPEGALDQVTTAGNKL
ncbi:mechanosensitive ion channel family protein [Cysteiniphilum sp. 6C5]|uniref:mechanosensitive ion channel family protein n=1 Tax=unclassified Cysteiniphilum TaxID=2610889 RepID=UPI003F87C980